MKNYYLLILLLVTTGMFAQNNFYGGLTEFYRVNPRPAGTNEEIESSAYNAMNRVAMIWGPRLFAHGGDQSAAATAMIDYAQNYTPTMSDLDPEWTNLGPNSSFTNYGGVGRIERICFDPQYNGLTNQTLYATSFGGLWRTENDGNFWEPLTDHLPFTANADVAVSYQSSNNIFLGTGFADGRFEYYNLYVHINALQTFGVYRSTDYGITWETISNGFIEEFLDGGTIRRIIINPENENQLFVATTIGVFRCNNAMATEPTWQKVLSFSSLELNDFRGLAFKPGLGNSNIVYASGRDIYKSTNGGSTFTPISINSLPVDYEAKMINLAVTPADPDRLYAYVTGRFESVDYDDIYIYLYRNSTGLWEQLHTAGTNDPSEAYDKSRMAFAVSPINANEFYFGHTKVKGTPDYTTTTITSQSPYSDFNVHADIHSLAFQPNVSNPDLFAGTDGGVSVKDLPNNTIYGWTQLYNGLSVNTIWGFDDSDYDHTKIMIGNQDNGTNRIDDYDNKNWVHMYDGDGYGCRFDKSSLDRWFVDPGSMPTRRSYLSVSTPGETNFKPNVCPDGHQNANKTARLPFFNHPKTNVMYMGLEEVFKRLKPEPEQGDQWDDIWVEESDLFNDVLPYWQRQIIDFQIAESNPDYMFIITGGAQNDPLSNDQWHIPAHLFISTTGGINGDCNNSAFEKVEYPGYDPTPEISFPIINSLTIDPNDENRIWVVYTGFVKDFKVYRGEYDGLEWAWTNEDPNETLANIPVNDIVYQYGSNDRLFIGTDAGVYVKDGPNSDWEKFGNIPNVRVNRLKINYCVNKLRAGTFGRGMWEADIPVVSNFTHKTIEDDIIWDENWSLNGDLVIECGNTLTIKGRLNMPPNSKIIVERGAKLVIDGGHITNGCGKSWQGIEIHGDSYQHQYEYGIGDRYQGMLVLKNGATIEHAYNAVTLWKPGDWSSMGGIIQATDANFYNNRRSVEFMSYQNFHPYLGEEYPMGNISYFKNCHFEVNNNYIIESNFYAHISMWDVYGVSIRSGSFINNMSLGGNSGYGIHTVDAGYSVRSGCSVSVEPCPEQNIERTVFEGLYAGIGALNSGNTHTIYVNQAEFNANGYGVKLNTIDNATIIKSKFNVGTNDIDEGKCEKTFGMGIELTNCNGYAVEENEFEGGYGAPGTDYTGIRIYYEEKFSQQQSVVYNEIYNNDFNMLLHANLAEGVNRNGDDIHDGLNYLCNINTNNYFDFYVTGEGIALMQGDFSKAAGNEFSKNASPEGSDFNNQAIWPVNYIYDNAVSVQIPENTVYVFTAGTNNSNSCLSNYGSTSGTQTDGRGLSGDEKQYYEQEFYNNLTTYSNVEALYQSLKDGGNTEAMQTEIETSWPSDMWELRSELLGKSPHLSKEVLITASDKTDVLPDAVIFEILSANPDELKDEELLKYLEDKENPLPQYMVDILRALAGNTTYKTILQSQLAYYNGKKTEAAYTLLRNMLNDSITDMIEFRNWLDNLQSLAMDYQIVDSYLQEGNNADALALTDMMPQLYGISGDDLLEYNRYKSLKQLQAQLTDEGRNIFLLTADEKSQLEDIVANSNARAGMQARNILEFVYGSEYCDCPIPIEESLKSSSAPTVELINKAFEPEIKAKPNPAKNWTTFSYKLPEMAGKAILEVSGAKGQIVQSVQLSDRQGQIIWDTRNIDPGVYIYTLKADGASKTGKVVITK